MPGQTVPEDPLAFIRDCIIGGRIRWTYHVTMRMDQRGIPSNALAEAVESLEVIETYPHDKYLPSFLLRGSHHGACFHAQTATDVEGKNVRVVTMYRPDPCEWDTEFRVRRKSE